MLLIFVNHRDLRTVGDEGLGIGERDRGLRVWEGGRGSGKGGAELGRWV